MALPKNVWICVFKGRFQPSFVLPPSHPPLIECTTLEYGHSTELLLHHQHTLKHALCRAFHPVVQELMDQTRAQRGPLLSACPHGHLNHDSQTEPSFQIAIRTVRGTTQEKHGPWCLCRNCSQQFCIILIAQKDGFVVEMEDADAIASATLLSLLWNKHEDVPIFQKHPQDSGVSK